MENKFSPFYTSRSHIEQYFRCPRYRYLNQFYNGKGIVPKTRNIPLVTGSIVHDAIGFLLARYKLLKSQSQKLTMKDLDSAIILAKKNYYELIHDSGFKFDLDKNSRSQQEHTQSEQIALAEALIRVWVYLELPSLVKRFEIIEIEKERTIEIASGIILQTRTDAELQSRDNGDYFNYSLKTYKNLDNRTEKAYQKDLQGITEIFGVESETGRKVSWIRFCFLIKGYFEHLSKYDKTTPMVQKSPLVRGIRNITPSGINFAASWYFSNENNKSGWGRLGKGWEEFEVWQEGPEAIKLWVKSLFEDVVNEGRKTIEKQCFVPIEYSRNKKDVEETLIEITSQEVEVRSRLFKILDQDPELTVNNNLVSKLFRRNRQACFYPTDCDYLDVCWKPEVGENPIEVGEFEYRVAHHQMEKESLEEK